MALSIRVYVHPDDVAAVVDPRSGCQESAGEINRSEFAPGQQKAVHLPVASRGAWRTIAVTAHDVARCVVPNKGDCRRRGVERAGEINCGEFAVAQQKDVGLTVGTRVSSCDVAGRIDLPRRCASGDGEANRSEFAPAQQVAVELSIGTPVMSLCRRED